MAWPVFSGEAWAAGASNLAPTFPTHASGDLLMAIVYGEAPSLGADATFALPSGWTRETSDLSTDTFRWYAVDWKIATSGSETATWVRGGTNEGHVQLFVIPAGSFDSSNPIGSVIDIEGAETNDGTSFYTLGDYTAPSDACVSLYVQHAIGDDIHANWYGNPAPATRTASASPAFSNGLAWVHDTTTAGDMGSNGGIINLLAGESATNLAIKGGAQLRGFRLIGVAVRAASAFSATLTDNFTGTTGADWDNQIWGTVEYQDSTSFVVIDTNRGQFEGKDSGSNRVGVFARKHGKLGDFELLTDLVQENTTSVQPLYVWLRGSGGWGADDRWAIGEDNGLYYPGDGVGFRYAQDSLAVVKSVAGTVSDVGTPIDPNLDGSLTLGIRARIVGEAVKLRVWDKAGAEPGTWNFEETVTGALTTGWMQMSRRSTNTTLSALGLFFDNLTIEDLTVVQGYFDIA